MKKFLLKVLCAGFSLLMLSCASTNVSDDLLIRNNGNSPALSLNEVSSTTVKVENPEYFNISDWSKIRITNDLLDLLTLQSEMSNEEKYNFMSCLFDELPSNAADGTVREVYVGKFFKNEKNSAANLVIRVNVLTPAKDAAVKNEKVFVFFTNALLNQLGGGVLKGSGAFYNLDANAVVIALYNGGQLTNFLYQKGEENNKKDSSGLSDLDSLMLAQNLLADEDLSNDSRAHTLASSVMNKKDVMPALKIMAMLKEYDYRISKSDLSGAKSIWKDILEYSVNVPGDMNEENLNAVNGSSLYLLEKLMTKDNL
ncbi:hypothetical protein [Treponema sp.]|uniref:hypothetical protein n=1 Tax=Treponema sp. TaxID=166 RepID=UPI0025E0CFEC|nr:hypothetical protein [Treponema sp.]MCR5217583.1 hypothetical protein [Treponema sp.]